MAQQEALSILRIGDYVTLKNVKNDEILCAEGILLEELTLCDKITNIDDCLYCIHLQRQYSASRELEEFLVINKYDEKSVGIRDPQIEKYYQALKKGANNERKLNDSYMKKKLGQIVSFGDYIQLFHVASRKYITVSPADLAKDERENIRITLDRTGTSFSWLQVCPRYKIDREGDRIMTNAEVYLKVSERSNEYIHRADRDPPPGRGREVNCSLETTSWKVIIFQSSVDSSNKKNLLASQLVYITDPETRCNLTISLPNVQSLDEELQLFDGNMENAADHELDFLEKEFCHDHGDLILKPPADYFSSNLLWAIETTNHTVGGPITIKTDRIRLKHRNTNLYLRQIHIEKEDENGEFYDEFGFTTTYYPDHDGTLFSLLQTNTNSKFLTNGRALQMGVNGVWIERGDVLEDRVYVIKGSKDKLAALNVIFNRYGSSVADDDQADQAGDVSTGCAEPLDVHVGLSGRLYLRKYLTMTELPKNDSVNTLWPKALRTDLLFFQEIIQKFVFFSQGFPISDSTIQLGIDKAEASLRTERQCLLCDQGILEIILKMIHMLIPITEKQEKIKANANKKKFFVSDGELAIVAMGQSILSKCFDLIYYSVLDNPEIQMYVADFMPTLLAHLNTQPLSGKCVTEMLSKNVELQETKIGKKEIQIFIDKLRSSKMNSMYLNLLQACCSCEGDGIDNNQVNIVESLFSNTNDIIIMINADFNKILPVKWIEGNSSEYLSLTPIPGSPIRADTLLNKGIPHLSLSWTTNSIDFSPLGLFGKLSVSVEELFRILSPEEIEMKKRSKNEKKKQSDDQKRAVANYFVSEMFLGAEMGMQRNYIAFHKLDNIFTYDVLISIIKMDGITNDIKSAAVRFLMCQHIDRDPQATTKIPVLTRCWSDIEKHTEPQLPFVESGRRYIFGLIQQLVSDHIKGMAGARWDELSRHMLKMLRTLVEFNFYGTIDRMKDVVGPLIRAIDRRAVADGNKNDEPSEKVEEKEKDVAAREEGDEANDEVPLIATDKELEGEENSMGIKEEEKSSSSFLYQIFEIFKFNSSALSLLSDDSKNVKTAFVSPLRYTKAPTFELETMVEAVDILAFAQKVIEDRNLSLLLRYFYLWENGSDTRSPPEIFEQVVSDAKELSLGISDFDNVMLDVLMFLFTPLVQSSLEVLMAHHSKRRTLLTHAREVQLLASHSRERQFRIVQQMLLDLENNAETQELWGPLEDDAARAVSKQTRDILKELIDICRIRRSVLEFDEEFMPDKEIQDLYRNLGCLDICMKVVGLLESIEEDDDEDAEDGEEKEVSESTTNTLEIVNLCTTLLYWFFIDNEKNQKLGYEVIEEFLDAIDEGINCHKVLQSLFKGNEYLMKQLPHSYFNDMIEKILKNGKSHHYLVLFASVSHVGEKNIMENQLEIVKSLTSPGRFQKLSCFFVPTKHPDYANKVELMAPFLNKRNVTLEELPPLISYHLTFLDVLSGCTVGRANLATVEAKVQSIFSYIDIIDAILDPASILLVKIKLSEFFFNSVVEVELKVPSLEQSACIWQLMESYKNVLTEAKDDFTLLNKYGLQSLQVNRQKIEYIVTCISIIRGFFMEYYDPNLFQPEEKEKKDKGKTIITSNYVLDIMTFFFDKIKDIYDLDSPHLSKDMNNMIYSTLETLSKYIHINESESVNLSKQSGQKEKDNKADVEDQEEDMGEDAEQKLARRYNEFLSELDGNDDIQYRADNENVAFISLLEKLPFMADPVVSDVRYETLIKKLVQHIRENVKTVDNKKQMDARVTATSCWIVRAFRTMIENKMGMSIYERDEDGGAEQDEATKPVVDALNNCGATALCLDLIAVGIDEKLQLEAIKLGVGLLFKEGGALEVQEIMYNHLNKTNSELFFKQVRVIVQKLQEWHNWNQIIILEEGQDPSPPEELLLLRFLQLMCEGHYLPNQDIMREQPNNSQSCNILEDFANYLNCLSRIPCRTSTIAGIRLSATILEVIQGPCVGNQAYFALSTELIETLNRLNRAKLINDCVEEEEIELKKTSIDIFQGLLEGQGNKSLVYEKILSVVHLDIILLMSKEAPVKETTEEESKEELEEEKVILQIECVVLLQMFCNFRPSLYDELGISRKVEDIVGSGTAMIEVIWRGDIHRRFFHVPRICEYLAKSSKDYLVEKVDRSNAENKLVDFLSRSHDLYKEVKHQQLLTEMNLSTVFSKTNLDRGTWFTFILAFSINIIMLFSYSAYSQSPPSIPSGPALAISVLNIIQTIGALSVLILNIVVRLPVKYQSLEDSGISRFETILYTALEPLTVYYILYLVMVIFGFIYYSFMPFLLLDIIIKNSTVQDVLNSVIFPRNQIMMGGVIILFIMQVYAFFLFMYFRNDMWETVRFCETLFDCYLVAFGYGLREGGGVGDVFRSTIGRRWLLDVSFYFVITVGMLNLIAGVIITTFGQLRENKAEQMRDTLGVCFICGIDKQIFDRASTEPDGFKTHVKIDHNLWNYLNFIFLLWEQDKDDDDGMEQYVRRAIDKEDIVWFPMNKAIRLEAAARQEESLTNDLKKKVQQSEANITTKLDKIQNDISIALEQLNQVLKKDLDVDIEDKKIKKRSSVTSMIFNKEEMEAIANSVSTPIENKRKSHKGEHKELFITLKELSGLDLDSFTDSANDDDFFCTLQIESGQSFTIKGSLANNNDDSRICNIKLTIDIAGTSETQNIDLVEVTVETLVLAHDSLLENLFSFEDEDTTCKLTLFPSLS